MTMSRRRAVIIGASIGGLLAAEALADSFEEVLLLEKDSLPSTPTERRGVPQGNQPHAIQMRGRSELEALFPGLLQALKDEGAFEFDPFRHVARLTPHGWAPRYDSIGCTALAASRPLLELILRRQLLAKRSNVRILEGIRVTGLAHRRVGRTVWIQGVLTDSRVPGLWDIRGDLVVDATGRGTKAPKWLSALGLPLPVEKRVKANCNYATRHYRAPAEAKSWWWKTLLIDQRPPERARGCAIFTVERERWIVTAIGTNGDLAPTDEIAWLDFIKSLPSPVAYELLQRAEPLSEIVQSRTTVNWWKLMHEYDAPLHGLLLFGDAVCGYNPSYGQGITASALAAQTLRRMARACQGPFDRAFLQDYYAAQADFLSDGWALSTSMDFRWPGTEGTRPALYPLVRQAVSLAEQIVVHDPLLLQSMIPLADFGAKPRSVVTPRVVTRLTMGLFRHLIARPQLQSDIDLFSSEPRDAAAE
jgi:2-polyprenyl-6-methoxyphenol hydroxylase-like FAD-dependent oxidoreductase